MVEKGTPMMFPTQWAYGILDSVLADSYGSPIAYIMQLEDGSKVAVDVQVAELLDDY